MRNSVVKKIRLDSDQTWNDNKGAYMMVMIDHDSHRIEFENLNSAAPDLDAMINFFLHDKDALKELKWASREYKRTFPIFWRERVGSSGCWDLKLCYSTVRHMWAVSNRQTQHEAYSLHVSCCDKLNEGIDDIFSGDLLDLLLKLREGEHLSKEKRMYFKYVRFTEKELIICRSGCGDFRF